MGGSGHATLLSLHTTSSTCRTSMPCLPSLLRAAHKSIFLGSYLQIAQVSKHVRRCSVMQGQAAVTDSAAVAAQLGLREAKKAMRKQLKQQLKGISVDDMHRQSSSIQQLVINSAFFHRAQSVGLYVTCERLREVDTMAVLQAALQQGKQCYIPLVEDSNSNMSLLHIDTLEDLQPAPPFGILEPSRRHPDGSPRQHVLEAPAGLDLLLMPGLGFDQQGHRLGRGGGYYDKLVHALDERAQQQGWGQPLLGELGYVMFAAVATFNMTEGGLSVSKITVSKAVALSFAEQLVVQVPMDSHDRRVDVLVTAAEVLPCTDRALDSL